MATVHDDTAVYNSKDELIALAAAFDLAGDHAPGEPALPMADWLEVEAQSYRLRGGSLAVWLAGRVDQLAQQARYLDARTPAEFDGREATADEDNLRALQTRYFDEGIAHARLEWSGANSPY